MFSPDVLHFIILPYVAMSLAVAGTIMQYRGTPYVFSSLSSQFLENRHHFWSLTPFHFGIMAVLTLHLLCFFMPREILLWNREPLRLYALEVTGLSAALLAIVGMANAVVRRATVPRMRVVTSAMDIVLLVLLVVQIATGMWIAIFHRWGSSWFASLMTPYLRSLLFFSPDVSFVAPLPIGVKLHVINAWLLLAVMPFSRLTHVLVAPLHYLLRRPIIVRWYRASGGRA